MGRSEAEIQRWIDQTHQQIAHTQLQIGRLQRRLEDLTAVGLRLEEEMSWWRIWHADNFL